MVAGELRLGAISTALTGLLPEILSVMISAHPHVEIYIEPGVFAELYRRVMDGDLDAAIVVEPQSSSNRSAGRMPAVLR
jgi:DNA-binding transcriptional LysR family regulator